MFALSGIFVRNLSTLIGTATHERMSRFTDAWLNSNLSWKKRHTQAVVTRDAISGISGSGNPTIVRVSLADSTRSPDTAVQLRHAYTKRRQTILVYIIRNA